MHYSTVAAAQSGVHPDAAFLAVQSKRVKLETGSSSSVQGAQCNAGPGAAVSSLLCWAAQSATVPRSSSCSL